MPHQEATFIAGSERNPVQRESANLGIFIVSTANSDLRHGHPELSRRISLEQREELMFIELTPLVQWSPQLINLETIRQIEPVKAAK